MARTPKADPEVEITEVAMMKKPELLDAVVTRTNLKKRDVKPAVEAALAVIGDALRDGTVVNLPPLGKLRLVKSKPLDGGAAVLTMKLRTPKHAAVEALGDPET
jgi:nucleoid DNA-binding protein